MLLPLSALGCLSGGPKGVLSDRQPTCDSELFRVSSQVSCVCAATAFLKFQSLKMKSH